MSPLESQMHEVIETTSAEEASQLRRKGWVVLSVGKGQDDSGEACLRFVLGWKRGGMDAFASGVHGNDVIPSFCVANDQQSS